MVTRAPDDDHPMLAKARQWRERACACKDKPCAQAVDCEVVEWTYAHQNDCEAPSEAVAKQIDEHMRRMEECLCRFGIH